MISLDNFANTNEKIYADFSFLSNSVSEYPSTNRETWGGFQQVKWPDQVPISAIAAATTQDPRPPDRTDMRPHVKDRRSKLWIMLDSGAAISIWPRSQYPQLPPSHSSLVAVNGSRISTFGTKDIHLDIEGQRYTHRFVIAEVQVPILGWDFLARFKLDLCWRSSHFRLIVHRPILGSTLKMIIGERRARIGDDDDYE